MSYLYSSLANCYLGQTRAYILTFLRTLTLHFHVSARFSFPNSFISFFTLSPQFYEPGVRVRCQICDVMSREMDAFASFIQTLLMFSIMQIYFCDETITLHTFSTLHYITSYGIGEEILPKTSSRCDGSPEVAQTNESHDPNDGNVEMERCMKCWEQIIYNRSSWNL